MKGNATRIGEFRPWAAHLPFVPTQLAQLDDRVTRVKKLTTSAVLVRYNLICAGTTHRRLHIYGNILYAHKQVVL